MNNLHRDEWGGVLTEDNEPLLVTGLSLSMSREGRFEANQNTDRIVACWNACAGLAPEQVAAIPRLIAWARGPADVGLRYLRELRELEEIFGSEVQS
jgi:hypothetical protein